MFIGSFATAGLKCTFHCLLGNLSKFGMSITPHTALKVQHYAPNVDIPLDKEGQV